MAGADTKKPRAEPCRQIGRISGVGRPCCKHGPMYRDVKGKWKCKATVARYQASQKGKGAKSRSDKKYAASSKGRASKAKYAVSPKGKEIKNSYYFLRGGWGKKRLWDLRRQRMEAREKLQLLAEEREALLNDPRGA